jgi:hypothetical protein
MVKKGKKNKTVEEIKSKEWKKIRRKIREKKSSQASEEEEEVE